MTHQHPFRFGVNLTEFTTADDLRSLACRMEELGYDTFSTGDHINFQIGTLATLMAVAAATTTLRVGTLVLGNDFRHPALVARELATIDVMSGGRLEFGLGTGWDKDDYERPGIPMDRPGVRVSRFEEAIGVFKGFFGPGPFDYEGTYYHISGLDGLPKPVQRPRPPILVGGGSPRMLSIAAREADIVSINLRTTADGQLDFASMTAEATDEKVSWVRRAAEERFESLELHTLVLSVLVTDNPRQALADRFARWGVDLEEFSQTISVEEILQSPHFLVGTADEIVDTLQARRERFGISYITLFQEGIEEFAPIVVRLAGR